MKIAAVICEYNPFHKGHAYHLAETRKQIGCDYVVGIMSGSFVQRGEPAALDKWVRAEMALSCGLDAVFELPCVYALSSAQYFAQGGVSLASALGADFLSFGSESPLEVIQRYVDVRKKGDYTLRLYEHLNAGLSYPQAATLAYGSGLNRISPNDLLGIEYMSSIAEQDVRLEPAAIPRIHIQHDSADTAEGFASAKQIRTELRKDKYGQEVKDYIPEQAYAIMEEWIASNGIGTLETYDLPILSRIRSQGKEALNQMPFAGGGLGSLVYNHACNVRTVAELIDACTSKYYMTTRISRFLLQILLDMSLCTEPVPYGRLLGFRRDSSKLIGELERRSSVPVVKSVAAYRGSLSDDSVAKKMLETDIRAQDLHGLAFTGEQVVKAGRDYTMPMVIVG
mgnify:CR=1 FL=1